MNECCQQCFQEPSVSGILRSIRMKQDRIDLNGMFSIVLKSEILETNLGEFIFDDFSQKPTVANILDN